VPVRDIDKITAYCKKEKLYLLEDCSHAHGASIYKKKVGSYGDAAAWSLQGQKIITGGEGGILLTNNRAIYERALLQGHYNKRPKSEISETEPMRKYFLTGMGLKLRAHPLAIAIAHEQFLQLDKFISTKQKFALRMTKAFKKYDFLVPPSDGEWQNSWYVYPLIFDKSRSHGVSRERFVEALLAEGLIETDIPGSTGLLNELPLFVEPDGILPRLYRKPLKRQAGFPKAEKYYKSLIKFPVWAHSEDEEVVNAYIAGVRKVADYIVARKSL
jgi:perosamine synthetase